MSYKAIFFDAGGTLFEPNPSVGHIYSEIAAKYGMKVSHQEIEAHFRAEFAKRDKLSNSYAHDSEKHEKTWWKDLVRTVFEKAVPLQNFDAFFEALYDYFATSEAWRLFPESMKVVERLKESGYILGIVSNWDSRLLSICKQMGFDTRFDFILASAVVGSAKPDAGIFKEALRRASVKPERALHVGDSIENDVRGAKKCGIDALLIDRHGRKVDNVTVIRSLTEVFEYLK